MRPAVRLRQRSLAGLWVAGVGFFVTGFTVSLAAYDRPTQLIVAGIVPLAVQCLLGTAAMAGLVRLTVPGADPDGVRRSGPKHSWPGRPSPDANGTMAPDVSPAGGPRPVLAASPPAGVDATGRGGG